MPLDKDPSLMQRLPTLPALEVCRSAVAGRGLFYCSPRPLKGGTPLTCARFDMSIEAVEISVLCERGGGGVTALDNYTFSTGQPRQGESGAHKAVSCAGLCAPPALRQPPALALTRP